MTVDEENYEDCDDIWPDVDPDMCDHSRVRMTARKVSGGSIQYRWQCQDCGQAVGQAVKAEVAKRQPVFAFDEDACKSVWDRLAEQREKEEKDWWSRYNAYLQSDVWRRKRDMRLKLDGGICQGCLEAKATIVHHRTYDHVGNELLFELISVCGPCHDRVHTNHDFLPKEGQKAKAG